MSEWDGEEFELTDAELSRRDTEAAVAASITRDDAAVAREPPPRVRLGEATVTTLSAHDRDLLRRMQSRLHHCYWCRKPYYEIENIGTWRCRAHIGMYLNDRWMCCGERRYEESGCVRTHHTESASVRLLKPINLSLPLDTQIRSWLDRETRREVAAGGEYANDDDDDHGHSHVASVVRFSEEDVEIVLATKKPAYVARVEHRRQKSQYRAAAGASVPSGFVVPQTRAQLSEYMVEMGVPRRYWSSAFYS